jgi:hypothetical protein
LSKSFLVLICEPEEVFVVVDFLASTGLLSSTFFIFVVIDCADFAGELAVVT